MVPLDASRRLVGLLVAGAVIAAVVLVLVQVEVAAGTTTRSCGSAFDVFVDRTGWQDWWAADLDDPDRDVRTQLARTRDCPAAVNRRIIAAAVLAGVAVAVIGTVLATSRTTERGRSEADDSPSRRIAKLGRRTAVGGTMLAAAGFVALVVLVADADSTLFLYTDRLVVAVVGLIVLVPPMALMVIGRVLSVLGTHLETTGKALDG